MPRREHRERAAPEGEHRHRPRGARELATRQAEVALENRRGGGGIVGDEGHVGDLVGEHHRPSPFTRIAPPVSRSMGIHARPVAGEPAYSATEGPRGWGPTATSGPSALGAAGVRAEYGFDYSKAVRGTYYRRLLKEGANVVVLEPDVAKAFRSSA